MIFFIGYITFITCLVQWGLLLMDLNWGDVKSKRECHKRIVPFYWIVDIKKYILAVKKFFEKSFENYKNLPD